MKLHELHGTRWVSLTPVSYQFPDFPLAQREWFDDANWLQIAGEISTPQASWKFTDPAMQVFEALLLTSWLKDAALQTHAPQVADSEGEIWPDLMFMEPNIGFSVAAYKGQSTTIRFHFSHESSNRGDHSMETLARQDHREIVSDAEVINRAADEWNSELMTFPERGTV